MSLPLLSHEFDATAADVRKAATLSVGEVSADLRESPTLFGPTSDPSTFAHLAYGVLIPTESNLGRVRSRRGATVQVQQDVTVRLSYRLRPNAKGDQLTDHDASVTDFQVPIVKRIMGFAGSHMPGILWDYVGSDRVVVDSGKWLLTDIQFTAVHNMALA